MTSHLDPLTDSGRADWSGWDDLTYPGEFDELTHVMDVLRADTTYMENPSASVHLDEVDGEIERFATWLTDEATAAGSASIAIYQMLTADEVTSTAVVVQCEDGDLLKISEVAAILRVDPETVRRYTKDTDPDERLERIRVGKVGVRVRCEEIRAYLQRRVDEARMGQPAPRPEPVVERPVVVPRPGEVRVYAPVRRRPRG